MKTTSLQLLGMKHSGKTTLGTLAARRLGWAFQDLDTLLEAEHPGESHKSSREIYRDLGKETFQEYEARAARKVAPHLATGNLVLAWGGGTATNPPAAEALRGKGTLVLLTESPEILFERIMRNGLPAFLSKQSPWADFQRLYAERMALMTQLCTIQLSLGGADIENALNLLFQTLEGDSHAR